MKSRGTLILVSLILAVALIACACSTGSSGSYTTKNYSHSMNNDGVKGTYDSFEGLRSYSKELKAGDEIKVTLTTVSGEMTFSIAAPDGKVLLTEYADGEYSCKAETDGKYEVSFASPKHSGGYSISW